MDRAALPAPSGTRSVVILTRETAIPLLRNITIVPVSRTVRDLPTTIELGPEHGLRHDCIVNADNVDTIPKDWLRTRVGELGPKKLDELARAVRTALDL
ncbi:MAG TPA: type II toxin-antitoxin system PemK/MazF family toxin [Pseudonocardia sp.]|nr:type II toxin-antitoxin system PemK/MazF family toxin [Pseudonocardia sp.]